MGAVPDRPGDHPHLRALPPRRYDRGDRHHRASPLPARCRAGYHRGHRALGDPARDHRCSHLPRPHPPGRLLLSGREPVGGVRDLERRHRHLRITPRRRDRRIHRMPAGGNPAVVVRRRAGPGDARRAVAGTAGQLRQPRALRPAHDPPVGFGDPVHQHDVPRGVPGRHAVPPPVPLRDRLEPDRSRRHPHPGTHTLPALGTSLRGLSDLVRTRPKLARSDPHRPHQRCAPRDPRQHLDLAHRDRSRRHPLRHAVPPSPRVGDQQVTFPRAHCAETGQEPDLSRAGASRPR